MAVLSFNANTENHVEQIVKLLDRLPRVGTITSFAPVIVVPWVFEPEFCRTLIALYQRDGGQDSGFMREVDGKTVGVVDYSHKRREDCDITDAEINRAAQIRIHRRIVPEIQKAFQFRATRIERHIVACYDAAKGGHLIRTAAIRRRERRTAVSR